MLRGVAALAVLIPHAIATYVERLIGPEHPVAQIGGALARHAVLVFFLLSGYLITRSIVANVQRNGRLDVAEYLTARIVRIYPPLIGTIGLVLVAWALIHGFRLPGSDRYGVAGDVYAVREAFTVRAMDAPNALLMRNGMLDADGPLWTLYIEFHLYLIAMFAAMGGSGKRLVWPIVAVALLAYWTAQDASFAFFAAVWALGAAVALARPHIGTWSRLVAIGAAVALGVALVLAPAVFVAEPASRWVGYAVQLGACLVYVQLIFLESRLGADPPVWLVRTGDFSYSLYVIHFPVLLLILSLTQAWMGSSMPRALGVAGGAVLVAAGTAYLFARFFEDQPRFRPTIRAALTLGRKRAYLTGAD